MTVPPLSKTVICCLLLAATVTAGGCLTGLESEDTPGRSGDDTGTATTSTVASTSETATTATTVASKTRSATTAHPMSEKLNEKLVVHSEHAATLRLQVFVKRDGVTVVDRNVTLGGGEAVDFTDEVGYDGQLRVKITVDGTTEELVVQENEGYAVYVDADGVVRVEAEVV